MAGRDLARMRRGQVPKLRRRIGIVFQDFRLLPAKTVYENVAFALEVTGASRTHIRQRVPQLLNLVGLHEHDDHLPTQLSGGEQQRVAIARALVHDPAMLIADEPTGNLDPVTSWEIIQLLIQINELGTTVLMATHNQEIVNAMRRRVLALEHGTLVRDESGAAYEREYRGGLLPLHRLRGGARLAGLLAQRDDEPGRHRHRDPDAGPAIRAVHRDQRPQSRAGLHRSPRWRSPPGWSMACRRRSATR